MKKIFFPALLAVLIFSGCYKDKADELYPGNGLFVQCDTTHIVSYQTHIVPIIQNYCIGCHSGSNISGSVDLSTYAGVRAVATDFNPPTLVGVTWHLQGYNPMPTGGNFLLDSCYLRQIQYWVDAGAPNN